MADTTDDLGGPEDMESWANSTKSLLGNAKSLASEWFEMSTDKDMLRPESPSLGFTPHVDRGPSAQKVLDAKLAVTKDALDLADQASQRCSTMLLMLQHERQSKWAALKVVEWRLALRQRRPAPELFRDSVQEALEREKQTLTDSRRKLAERAAEAKVAVEDCDANKVRLLRNVRFMVLAGEPNPPPMTSPEPGEPGSSRTPASPSGRASLQDSNFEEAFEGEEEEPSGPSRPAVPSSPKGLLRRAPQLKDLSLQLFRQGELFVEAQRQVCEKAHDRVLVAFRKRHAENLELKKQLEHQMSQMDNAISTAELSLSRMKRRIDLFGETELEPKFENVTALLEKLRCSKCELEEDFQRKVVSMRIDDSCRKITPERTVQDPASMAVAALLSGKSASSPKGKRREKTMNKVASAPDFANSAVSTTSTLPPPRSPAGASLSLKAAASASLGS